MTTPTHHEYCGIESVPPYPAGSRSNLNGWRYGHLNVHCQDIIEGMKEVSHINMHEIYRIHYTMVLSCTVFDRAYMIVLTCTVLLRLVECERSGVGWIMVSAVLMPCCHCLF